MVRFRGFEFRGYFEVCFLEARIAWPSAVEGCRADRAELIGTALLVGKSTWYGRSSLLVPGTTRSSTRPVRRVIYLLNLSTLTKLTIR
jgi:hypothetical protein